MALSFAHGSIRALGTDAVNTVYTVSGLTFQPKALRFYWNGSDAATEADTDSATRSLIRGVGFATSTSDRRCVASTDLDNSGSMATFSVYFNTAAVVIASATSGASLIEVDLNSITADGFTLIIDVSAGGVTHFRIFWEAWGGSDITVAVTGDITEPATAIAVDYTATGLVAAATDQVVMFAGIQSVSASGTAETQDSGHCIGFATDATHQCCVMGNNDQGSANADTDGYGADDLCIGMIAVAGGNATARAAFTQYNTDGFRLTWAARALTGRRYIFMAIKGGDWQAGGLTISGNSLNATASVSGLAFTPIGLSLMGRMTAEQAAGTSTVQDRIGLGSGSSTSSRRAMGALSLDGAGNTDISLTMQFDQVLAYPSAGALVTAYDIAQLDYGSDANDINQPNSSGGSQQILGGTGSSAETDQAVAQSFTAVSSHTLTEIRVTFATTSGTPVDQVQITLLSGSVTGDVLGVSTAISVTSGVENTFPFTPITITSGVKYYFVVERTGARDISNRTSVLRATTSEYAAGGFYDRDNNVWSAESATDDLVFKVRGKTPGFVLINDLAGGVASEWIGYLTFGSVPSTDVGLDAPYIMVSRMRTW